MARGWDKPFRLIEENSIMQISVLDLLVVVDTLRCSLKLIDPNSVFFSFSEEQRKALLVNLADQLAKEPVYVEMDKG